MHRIRPAPIQNAKIRDYQRPPKMAHENTPLLEQSQKRLADKKEIKRTNKCQKIADSSSHGRRTAPPTRTAAGEGKHAMELPRYRSLPRRALETPRKKITGHRTAAGGRGKSCSDGYSDGTNQNNAYQEHGQIE